jgi:hypothetical protein
MIRCSANPFIHDASDGVFLASSSQDSHAARRGLFRNRPSPDLRQTLARSCHARPCQPPTNQCPPRLSWPRCRNALFMHATIDGRRAEGECLNLAIPYAVQSGFRYPASLMTSFRLTSFRFSACPAPLSSTGEPCVAKLSSRPSGALVRVFGTARHPHLGAIPWPQTSRFRPIFQVLFYRNTTHHR